MERAAERVKVDRPRCPFCHGVLEQEEAKRGCESCLAWHHAECWREHGRCAACGLGVGRRASRSDRESETVWVVPNVARESAPTRSSGPEILRPKPEGDMNEARAFIILLLVPLLLFAVLIALFLLLVF